MKLSPADYSFGGSMIQPYFGLWDQPSEGIITFDYHEERVWKFTEPLIAMNLITINRR